MEDLQLHNLPHIRTSRTTTTSFQQHHAYKSVCVVGTPVANHERVHTPAFQQFHRNKERQLWQGYYRTYEQDMHARLMKSLTKGPKMDFPRFEGIDLVEWIM